MIKYFTMMGAIAILAIISYLIYLSITKIKTPSKKIFTGSIATSDDYTTFLVIGFISFWLIETVYFKVNDKSLFFNLFT